MVVLDFHHLVVEVVVGWVELVVPGEAQQERLGILM